jgi:glycosyltransferase involved in cell wall biosynthesis
MSCYRKFDTIVSVSKSVGSAIKTLFPDISNPFTIYNGIDSDRIRELSERQSFLQDQSFTFVTCGRLVPQKGFDRLIEASYRLHKEGFLFKVVVIGEGKERKELENSLTKKDLSNTVVLLGYKDNPYPIFKQSSCYICSSRTEGLPLVILEAMTLGIPVVSTDCSGPNEIIGNSEFGLLVSNDTDGIYEGMKLLLSDKGLLNHYHLKSLERYRSFDVHNWMIAVDKLLSN